MITKEEIVKILSGNHFLKSWEIIAEEILALNEKEGFPKYKKYIGINMGSHPKCWNGTVYPIENQVDLDNLDRKNWIVCSKEEYDKQPILTTEDGVEVALGDSVFYVFNDETPEGNGGFNRKWKPLPIKASSDNAGNNYYKLFSTEEAAFNYIETKKPILKTHDDKDVLLNDNIFVVTDEFKIIPNVRVTKSISIRDGYKVFTSHDEAHNYMVFNKPCLSLDDILTSADNIYETISKSHLETLVKIIKSRIN